MYSWASSKMMWILTQNRKLASPRHCATAADYLTANTPSADQKLIHSCLLCSRASSSIPHLYFSKRCHVMCLEALSPVTVQVSTVPWCVDNTYIRKPWGAWLNIQCSAYRRRTLELKPLPPDFRGSSYPPPPRPAMMGLQLPELGPAQVRLRYFSLNDLGHW